MRPSIARPLCLRALSGKLKWPFLPSTSTTCGSTHLDHGGMLPRPLMTGVASCLGLQLTGGGNSIKLPSRKSHPRTRTQRAFASYATMPLGGDLASTCMHAWSMKDASMQASFPNPCDRAVHRREPLRNPARRLLPCWIGLRDSSNTAVVSLPLSSPPGPGLSAKDIALQNILRAAHVGHYFGAFQREGVLPEMLPTLEFAELRTAFNFTLKQWRDLQLAMKNARTACPQHLDLRNLSKPELMIWLRGRFETLPSE